ncbi:hypothetical protein GCM10010124_21590 [Pilimelia terevasa]|uniref:Prepilin-type N-terminal cleavage/methylation domain-containing protein n=1 Tax=Pilimelia terevasa TaxID=53372 RepID=A0A8J3BKC6_9ACTN|nr:prepilin-type N-terminal cleavage/methylation domain-containing protein [Pilimelia terevasa]GGK28575.1 hypothetical protein GCM10010124_21590 [Pilimelia terevasa]
MQHLLRSLRARRDRGDAGFTLIELLVVVVIIGVLVAIAVPTYLSYREGAADKAAQSDVRSGISAIEAHYTNNGNQYPGAPAAAAETTVSTNNTLTVDTMSIRVSENVTVTYTLAAGAATYTLCAVNANGTAAYTFSSQTGGAPTKKTTAPVKTC